MHSMLAPPVGPTPGTARLFGRIGMLAMCLAGDRTKWYRTKWHGQNGTDKMVYGQNGMGQNGMDKMVRTKWYIQNGTDKI